MPTTRFWTCALIMDESKEMVNVPVLEKEISVTEPPLTLRNVHNQVKQQVGSAVRDCVVSVLHKLCTDGVPRNVCTRQPSWRL